MSQADELARERLATEVQESRRTIAELQRDVDRLQTQLDRTSQRLQQSKDDTARLRTTATELRDKITDLSNRSTQLSKEKAELEKQLDQALRDVAADRARLRRRYGVLWNRVCEELRRMARHPQDVLTLPARVARALRRRTRPSTSC